MDWIDWRYYTLYKDDSEYSAGIKPLENMNTMMIVGGFLTGLLGIALIAVLMVHGTKKRTREMGILMALGISAKEIRRLVWKEYLLLTTAALCLALALGTAMLPVIGNGIYQGFRGDQSPKEYTEKEIEAAILRGGLCTGG